MFALCRRLLMVQACRLAHTEYFNGGCKQSESYRKHTACRLSDLLEHCRYMSLVRILVHRHTWAIFLRKWATRGLYSQCRSLSGHVERIFVYKNWRGRYWQHLVSTGRRYVPTAEATLDILRLVFEDCIISRRVDAILPPWSCDLTPLDYYLWDAVKNKCYTDKPELIDALKDIGEAIGELQLSIHNR